MTGGVDEYFTRTDSSGTSNFLTDSLGSTLELTDTSGNSQVQYSYAPFGNISITGTTNNTYTYAGREIDGLGLYYYRARYYNPAIGRFISEDPIGFAGGINIYAYAYNDPLDFRDPSGNGVIGAVIGFANGITFGALGGLTSGGDWQDAAFGALAGGITGAGLGLLDPTEGALASPLAAGAGDFAAQAFHKWRHGQNMSWGCYNWGEVAGSAIGGGVAGGLSLGLDALGASAGLSGSNSLTFGENLLGNNVGLASTTVGGAIGNPMSGRKPRCQ